MLSTKLIIRIIGIELRGGKRRRFQGQSPKVVECSSEHEMRVVLRSCVFLLLGCVASDTHSPIEDTSGRLRELGLRFLVLRQVEDYKPKRYLAIDELVKDLVDFTVVSRFEADVLTYDAWRQKFVLSWQGEGVLRITSCGRNQIDDNGSCDDMYIETPIDPIDRSILQRKLHPNGTAYFDRYTLNPNER